MGPTFAHSRMLFDQVRQLCRDRRPRSGRLRRRDNPLFVSNASRSASIRWQAAAVYLLRLVGFLREFELLRVRVDPLFELATKCPSAPLTAFDRPSAALSRA